MPTGQTVEPITVTVETAAALSGLSRRTIWTLIKNGSIPSRLVGGRRLIPHRELKDFLSTTIETTHLGAMRGPIKVFNWNQIALLLNQDEVSAILAAIRAGHISGQTAENLTSKLHDVLISADRDPKDFGFGGEECTVGLCKEPK